MFFRKKNYHSSLIEKMSAIHYGNVEGGICYGIAAVALQAVLLRDTAAYDQRINYLFDIPAQDIPHHLAKAQEEWKLIVTAIKTNLKDMPNSPEYQSKLQLETQKAWDQMDKRAKILISANGFFDSISLHQSPDQYRYLFTKKDQIYNQEFLSTAVMLAPEALAKQGGITEVDDYCGAYTVAEIHQLLVSLRSQLTSANIDFPVAVMLCSYNHAFTLGLDPKHNKWMLLEANNGPTQFLGDYTLAKKINTLFSENEITVFDTRIFTTADHYQTASPVIDKWKKSTAFIGSQRITKERLLYRDSDEANLLYVAAQNGHVDTVKKLIALGADVNNATRHTPSPLYIASYCGHTEVVKELLKNGAYVDADYFTGISPLVAAANSRHIDIVKMLLDHGAKLFEIIRDKEVIKLLQEYKTAHPEERSTPSSHGQAARLRG